MNFILRAFFRVFVYGIVGYLILLSIVVFNKYISYSLTHQYNSSENMNFIGTLVYIFTNRLTHDDFMFCFYGLVFMIFVGMLKNFERRTRIY